MIVIKNYIKGLFTIDEKKKASSIMLILFLLVGIAVYQLLTTGTTDGNLTGLIGIVVGTVATMNIFNDDQKKLAQQENKEEM